MTRLHRYPVTEDRTLPDGTVVQRYRLLPSLWKDRESYAYSAWLPDGTPLDSRPLPAEIRVLPEESDERMLATEQWDSEREELFDRVVFQAFPGEFEEQKAKTAPHESLGYSLRCPEHVCSNFRGCYPRKRA